jgi:hypothetical protein
VEEFLFPRRGRRVEVQKKALPHVDTEASLA